MAVVGDEPTPELQAAREELGIVAQVMGVMGDARIPAREHQAAEKILAWIQRHLDAAQTRVNALVPAEQQGPLSQPTEATKS